MIIPEAVLVGRRVQVAHPQGAYGSKTDQTAQTDQHLENAGKFGAPHDQKPTRRHQKLTSGTAQKPNSGAQDVGSPIDSAHGAPQP
jgi:hypothetical protein